MAWRSDADRAGRLATAAAQAGVDESTVHCLPAADSKQDAAVHLSAVLPAGLVVHPFRGVMGRPGR
jgi:hypothetical protein